MDEHKVAIITDTHFGCRKGSQLFHNYFQEFYDGTFFHTLDSRSIDTVVHCGDCFDVRKGIDYWSLDWAKTHFFNPLRERGIKLHMIVGNHDIFYKNNLSINAPTLNLAEYDNISIYQAPQTVSIHDRLCFMVPWICDDNAEEFTEQLDDSSADVCFGHLELAGFYATQGYLCEHGLDPDHLKKFDKVFSGHFHKKSTKGNITYLGNPYQMFWNDEGDTRGFHIFDLDTHELEFIKNPTSMFRKIYFNKGELINPNQYQKLFIKMIVGEGVTPINVSNLTDALYDNGCHDVKIIETLNTDVEEDVEVESEDTLTTLTNYVNAMDDNTNKQNLIEIFKSLYIESQEV